MKRITFIVAGVAAIHLGSAAGLLPGGFEAQAAKLVSIDKSETDSGNGFSSLPVFGDNPVFSADGSKVAFVSEASDLVPADTNGKPDVFVRDFATGTTTLVSVNFSGTDSGNGPSANPLFSADGTRVVFSSLANDLDPIDMNSWSDIYVRDLTGKTTTLVSVNDSGTDGGNGFSIGKAINTDGTMIAFISAASDLGPTDSNGVQDVYVRDLFKRTTMLVSIDFWGLDSGNAVSLDPAISADGTKVAFQSLANDLGPTDSNGYSDIYLRDLNTRTTTLVSINGSGRTSGNAASINPAITADGVGVAFESKASNLGAIADTNGRTDVYVRDIAMGTTTLVSVNGPGTDSGNAGSHDPAFSADGTRVAFRSIASDLGSIDTNGFSDVYFRDLVTGKTVLVSVNDSGTDSGNGIADGIAGPAFGADGTRVAFQSRASDLGPTDTNGTLDVYVRDLVTEKTILASINDSGTDSGNAASGRGLVFSDDGNMVAFGSEASDLGPTDTNGFGDVYIAEVAPGCGLPGDPCPFADKLNAARRVLIDADRKNDAAAILALETYIKRVGALRGKRLTDAETDALILEAREIIDASAF